MAQPLADLTPPPYWWLAALACLGQGLWGLLLIVARWRRGRVAHAARSPFYRTFLAGGCCGLVYGVLQHDAVLVLGQGCALVMGMRWRRAVNKDTDE